LLKRLCEGFRVDARHRDIGTKPIDEQRAEGEPDPLLEVLGLGEGRKIEIGSKLLGCRCHKEFSASSRAPCATRKRGGWPTDLSALNWTWRAVCLACPAPLRLGRICRHPR